MLCLYRPGALQPVRRRSGRRGHRLGEIYVFSSDKVWANYEAIQADIFDHLLAALPVFDLRIFQTPSGFDFRHINEIPESSTGI